MNHPSTELKNQEEVPRIIRKQKALAERFALINRLPDFGFLELKKDGKYSVLCSTDMALSDNLCRKIFELFVH